LNILIENSSLLDRDQVPGHLFKTNISTHVNQVEVIDLCHMLQVKLRAAALFLITLLVVVEKH